jgi:hypothetical protein
MIHNSPACSRKKSKKRVFLEGEIRSLNMKVEETTIVEKLLRSVSNKLLPIVSTIE